MTSEIAVANERTHQDAEEAKGPECDSDRAPPYDSTMTVEPILQPAAGPVVTTSDTVSFMPTDIQVMSMYSSNNKSTNMIDNSRINYLPIKLRCGVIAMIRTNVMVCCPSVLQCLNKDLLQCLEIMPVSVRALILRTRIWVNLSYSYGPRDNLRLLKHTTAHHHDAWLLWARDRPDKVWGIEIYDCRDYQRMRLHWNGAGLICHELCHLIHQFALQDGLRNAKVLQAYLAAKHSGLYDKTLRRDWAGLDCDWDLAYAMVDHKEFFAELSVAYLSDTYQHLEKGDSSMMESCSPPYLEHNVVKRIKERKLQMTIPEAKGSVRGIPNRQLSHYSTNVDDDEDGRESAVSIKNPFLQFLHCLFKLCRPASNKTNPLKRIHPPCNKFYPFTRGQLRGHDAQTYDVVRELWREIELWEDPKDDLLCGKGLGGLFAPLMSLSKFQSS